MKVFILLVAALIAAALAAPKSARLIGGEDADVADFPFQVSLQVITSLGYGDLCGGVILDHNRLLTSAGCAAAWPSYGLHVIFGRGSPNETSRGPIFHVSHQNFSETTLDHDISIITWLVPLVYNEYVQPIPLANASYVPSGELVAIGHGSTNTSNTGERVTKLKRVTLTALDSEECAQEFEGVSGSLNLTDTMLCASAPGKSLCQGDQGGPLIAKDENGNDFLAGIASWNIRGCQPNHPSVFTSIAPLREWIDFVLNPLNPNP